MPLMQPEIWVDYDLKLRIDLQERRAVSGRTLSELSVILFCCLLIQALIGVTDRLIAGRQLATIITSVQVSTWSQAAWVIPGGR